MEWALALLVLFGMAIVFAFVTRRAQWNAAVAESPRRPRRRTADDDDDGDGDDDGGAEDSGGESSGEYSYDEYDEDDDESDDGSGDASGGGGGGDGAPAAPLRSLRAVAAAQHNPPSPGDREHAEQSLLANFMKKSIVETSTATDLTRLVRRIHFAEATDADAAGDAAAADAAASVAAAYAQKPSASAGGGADAAATAAAEARDATAATTDAASVAALLGNVWRCLDAPIRSDERSHGVRDALDAFARIDALGVPEVHLRALFDAHVTDDTHTAALCKCINQGVLVPPLFHLRTRTPLTTRDVKDASGWRVRIAVAPDGRGAAVTTIKAERSAASETPHEDFRIEYVISFFFGSWNSTATDSDAAWRAPAVSVHFAYAAHPSLAQPLRQALRALDAFNARA